MKNLVLGLGVSGKAAKAFLEGRSESVVGYDDAVGGPMPDVRDFDRLVVSPGVPQTHPIYKAALEAGVEVVGEVELAMRYLPCRAVGITGTNGKTTTTLLVAHVLRKCGIVAHALGNIGLPLTAQIESLGADDVAVVELSSYQLETLNQRCFEAGTILNITADHLDRYGSMEKYIAAKFRLADLIKPGGQLFVGEGVSLRGTDVKTFAVGADADLWSDGEQVIFEQTVELHLKPEYRYWARGQLDNFLAAYALCRSLGLSPEQFWEATEGFSRPPHRMEVVEEVEGVTYVNDSKGTNLDAVLRAVGSLEGPIVLIAGGRDKGGDFEQWKECFAGKVTDVCLIGEAARSIEQAISSTVPVHHHTTLDSAVRQAAALAQAPGCVLLSPGCSSFDMFKNFEHRGDRFKEIVRGMKR